MDAKKKKSFTLIELLVVVAIIAVLVAILLPALGNARQMGRSMLCSSNLRQIGIAYRMYAQDYHGKLPLSWDTSKPGQENWHLWEEYAQSYLPDRKVWKCPNSPWPDSTEVYAINVHVNREANIIVDWQTKQVYHAINIFEDLLTTQTLFFTEGPNGWKNVTWEAWPPPTDCTPCLPGGIHLRHQLKANMVMLDGHVEQRAESEIPDYPSIFWYGN